MLKEAPSDSLPAFLNLLKEPEKNLDFSEDFLQLTTAGENEKWMGLAAYYKAYVNQLVMYKWGRTIERFNLSLGQFTPEEKEKISELLNLTASKFNRSASSMDKLNDDLLEYFESKGTGGLSIVAQLLNHHEIWRYKLGDLDFGFPKIREKFPSSWNNKKGAIDWPSNGFFWGKIEEGKVDKWAFIGDFIVGGVKSFEIEGERIDMFVGLKILHPKNGILRACETTEKAPKTYSIKQSNLDCFSDLLLENGGNINIPLVPIGILKSIVDNKMRVLWGNTSTERKPEAWSTWGIDWAFPTEEDSNKVILTKTAYLTDLDEKEISQWLESVTLKRRRERYGESPDKAITKPKIEYPKTKKSEQKSDFFGFWSPERGWQLALSSNNNLRFEIEPPKEVNPLFTGLINKVGDFFSLDSKITPIKKGTEARRRWYLEEEIGYKEELGNFVKEGEKVTGVFLIDNSLLARWENEEGELLGFEPIACVAEIPDLEYVGRKRLPSRLHKEGIERFEVLLRELATKEIAL